MGMGNDGGNKRAISVLGKARAVRVTALYIAPEAPSEGRMEGAEVSATAAAAAVLAVVVDGVADAARRFTIRG